MKTIHNISHTQLANMQEIVNNLNSDIKNQLINEKEQRTAEFRRFKNEQAKSSKILMKQIQEQQASLSKDRNMQIAKNVVDFSVEVKPYLKSNTKDTTSLKSFKKVRS
jgi:hypothetical protein